MQLVSAIRSYIRSNDNDTDTDRRLTPSQARNATELSNSMNVLLYVPAAALGPIGSIAPFTIGGIKLACAGMIFLQALGEHGDYGKSCIDRATTLFNSGAENVLVGAAACVPVAGQYFAGVMAGRSAVEVIESQIPSS